MENKSFSLVTDPNELVSEEYNTLPKKKKLEKEIKPGKNMVKEFISNFAKKKTSFPIYFNEPITMLQKQYERFYFSDFLEKAALEKNEDLKLIHIAGFFIGEIFLSLNRLLKPFNPIMGETYEYFDNIKKMRFISEQVSHIPPISAFCCESENFAYFGDNRVEMQTVFVKGCLSLNFNNKTHLILKNTNDYYIFSKPKVLMKGLVFGPPYNEYAGNFELKNIKDKKRQLIITFYESSKTVPKGKFEGKVINENGDVIYLIGGNCNSEMYYTKPDGSDKRIVIMINESEEYLKNSQDKYTIPSCACELNVITDQLKEILPPCDSRMRPDLREYESGDTDVAQKIKYAIEEKQILLQNELNKNKTNFVPEFFVEEFNDISQDKVFISNGKYWELRKNKQLKDVQNKDIFVVDNK